MLVTFLQKKTLSVIFTCLHNVLCQQPVCVFRPVRDDGRQIFQVPQPPRVVELCGVPPLLPGDGYFRQADLEGERAGQLILSAGGVGAKQNGDLGIDKEKK